MKNKKALLIGITSYTAKPLEYCINDVDDMEKLLRDNGDFSANFDVKRLDNCKNARIANDAIKELFADKTIDTALFYFSGHGYLDANNNGEIMFPDNIDEKSIYYGIKMEDIMQIVSRSPVKNKIIILDCCKSGIIGSNSENNQAQLPDGCAILASCLSDQISIESSESKHGTFTNLLIQALKGEAADYLGRITVGGIYAHLDLCLGAWEQRPIFKSNVSTFVPIRTIKPRITRERMIQGLLLFNNEDDDFALDPEYEATTYPNQEEAKKYPKCMNFQLLQDLQKIGFVEPSVEQLPEGKKFMYYAALFSKSCRLTTIGKNYWNLNKKNKLQ